MTLSAQQSCPICGEANGCAIANNAEASNCWCMEVNIPEELIEQANQRGDMKRCICQACAESVNSLAKEL
ncbi:MAG: cysteine-rich CWC family protein [Oceanicoccus sp.]|uniref:cysteine-rich CWC family protein n=1 Tax=Oceanicoccus sp. TaxID=2691044 RepID=UPI0026342A89|nr:cysteine-rich CWC family protein [Oceanicoccus sp.]MCP3907017.1 cysteine-rich CWC family protein [Oceanicoccus sp.]MDG1773147.1 cysteine-rich CWC family protein [Oceanicoccus sp.]